MNPFLSKCLFRLVQKLINFAYLVLIYQVPFVALSYPPGERGEGSGEMNEEICTNHEPLSTLVKTHQGQTVCMKVSGNLYYLRMKFKHHAEYVLKNLRWVMK